jgi:hypothetical protein
MVKTASPQGGLFEEVRDVVAKRELDVQRIWKGYFGHVAVEERQNRRLQWKSLRSSTGYLMEVCHQGEELIGKGRVFTCLCR